MKRKIFGNMCLLALITVLLSTILLSIVFYRQLTEDMQREMNNGAAYIAAAIETGDVDYLYHIKGEDKNSRITLIDTDGTVLFDSRVPISEMDNHADRPEVKEAMKTGRGEIVRMSDTVDSQTYYLAVELFNGTVLRLSSTTDSVFTALVNSFPFILLITFFVLFFSLLLARYQTKKIVVPINSLDLENPTENDIYDELSPLLNRIHQQRVYIEKQMKELQKKQDQFTAITENMEEGLIVLDETGRILSINKSAIRFLGGKKLNQTGKHISTLNRDLQLQKAVDIALKGDFSEEVISSENCLFQLRINPVFEEGLIKGAILIIFDMTEKHKAEKIRREFSANVSHELKTPLTAISGFAELLKNSMVKREEISSVSGKIYEEARRLIGLIEDIIQLSKLDEKEVSLSKEEINLLNVAITVKERLDTMAKEKGIVMSVKGKDFLICAVPQLIEEMIYNLCVNAIKYNKENGRVFIEVQEENGKAVLSVRDTGIGIPQEHQERIFERFYRVDKSHSKETGGTGLGLSIVKHIVAFHNGEIYLKSIEGKGTEILIFL